MLPLGIFILIIAFLALLVFVVFLNSGEFNHALLLLPILGFFVIFGINTTYREYVAPREIISLDYKVVFNWNEV